MCISQPQPNSKQLGAKPVVDAPLVLTFNPLKTQVPIYRPDVTGFSAAIEATQADADAVASALEGLYAGLTPAQQTVFDQLVLQAGHAAA